MNRSTNRSPRRELPPALRAMLSALFLVAAAFVSACTSTETTPQEGQSAVAMELSEESMKPGPAALWARNCARCHNYQPPSRYSDAEWSIVMHHMRLQCYLTGEEQRAIEQLMRSANN